MAFTFLTLSLLSHRFGKGGLGSYATSFGISSTLCYLVGLGAPEGVARLAAGFVDGPASPARRARLAVQAHLLSILCSTLAIAVGAALCLAAPSERETIIWTVIWTAGWGLSVSSSHCLIAMGVERLGSFLFYTAGAGVSVAAVSVSLLLGYGLHGALVSAAMSYLSLGLAGTIAVAAWARFSGPLSLRVSWADVRSLIVAGAPFSTARLVTSAALWVPVWGAGIFMGTAGAGVTSAVMRLALAAGAAMAATRLVLRRVIADQMASGHWRRLSLLGSVSGTIFGGITLLGIAVAWVFGNPILHLLFGADFKGYRDLLCLALVGPVLENQFGVAEDVLKNRGDGLRVIIIQVFGVAVQWASLFLLWHSSIYAFTFVYVLYDFVVQITYVTWLGRTANIWIRPILSIRAFRTFLKLQH